MNKNPNNNIIAKVAIPNKGTGNAINPPAPEDLQIPPKQLLDEKAETYLREAGNIEDMPDEKDWKEADKTIEETNKNS
ncbi:MAG: hypothetical protein M3413_06990 [Bacteroidota bacterium]|jgi:hypothetical protein|nr:hypothetical protein [Bacteroidota bacterium]